MPAAIGTLQKWQKQSSGIAHESLGCHRNVVLHWGELGTRWSISFTIAQIRALLYSRSALSAEEIADALSVARCKVSTSPKEL
jgi:DNA-binding transcriptional regulator GbsR (MarR family)